MHQVGRRRLELSPFDDPLGSRTALAMTVENENALLKTKRTCTRIQIFRPQLPGKEQKHGGNGYSNMNGCGSFGNKYMRLLLFTLRTGLY